MSHEIRSIATALLVLANLALLPASPAHAAFAVTSTCQTDVMIQEGDPGSIDCTVTNPTADPIYIQGDFGWVVTLAHPDRSDRVIQVTAPHLKPGGTLIGGVPYNDTTIAAGGTDMLKFLLSTDTADVNELPIDYGINIINVLFNLSTAPSPADGGTFVPSTDTGGIVYVLDAPNVPVTPPTRPLPHFNVGSGDNYDGVQNRVEARGFVTTAPEPSTLALSLVALAALGMTRRRRNHADGIVR